MDIEIDFNVAVMGGTETVSVPRLVTCDTCYNGNGIKPDSRVSTCDECNGVGVVIDDNDGTSAYCTACQGTGNQVEEYCDTCNGHGRIQINEEIAVQVPARASNSKLCIPGKGDSGINGGPPGDLYIFVKGHSTSGSAFFL